MIAELISKDPGNVWCPYYHVLLDDKMYYVYERHVFSGYGIAANLPDHSEFYLIDQASYEAESVSRGKLLCVTSGNPWHEEMRLVIETIRSTCH